MRFKLGRGVGALIAIPLLLAGLPARATVPAIVAADALGDVRALSAPEMEGRGAFTEGIVRAGEHIVARFRAAGLAGGGEGGSFFQTVDLPDLRLVGPGTRLVLGGEALAITREFAPNPSPRSVRGIAGIVFAGYGVVVPGVYDDYAGLDARGKLVICLRYAPGYDSKTGRAANPAFDQAAALQLKVRTALERGAAAVAIVDVTRNESEPIAALGELGGRGPAAIPSFHLDAAAATRLLARDGESLEALKRRMDELGVPAGRALSTFAEYAVDWQTRRVRGRNIIAVVEGTDPALRHEAVLIGAHYDHLGRGDEGSALGPRGAIHPGADDNASGTAAMLEVAQALSVERPRPRRSVVFAAFTGEEKGLLGSAVAARGIAGKRLVAMINMDMVGRMRGGAVEVGGTTTSPTWRAIVDAANAEKLNLSFPAHVVPNSDHASFLLKGVPALFLFTGLHRDYHRPTDSWDKVDAEGIARTARLVARIARAVAERQEQLAFVAPQWTRGPGFGASRGTGVRLGVMPDYEFETGLRIADILPGGPAEAAGLKPGDVVVAIGNIPVTGIDTYMEALASHKPGERVVVRIKREEGIRDVDVTFTTAR